MNDDDDNDDNDDEDDEDDDDDDNDDDYERKSEETDRQIGQKKKKLGPAQRERARIKTAKDSDNEYETKTNRGQIHTIGCFCI